MSREKYYTLAEMKRLSKEAGSCMFDKNHTKHDISQHAYKNHFIAHMQDLNQEQWIVYRFRVRRSEDRLHSFDPVTSPQALNSLEDCKALIDSKL